MQRPCNACGRSYEAKRVTSKFCSPACRQRSHESGRTVEVAFVERPRAEGSISSAVRVELEAVGRLSTSAGQRALHLASLLEAVTADSGSSKAALDKQLASALEQALDGARRAADPLDELEARRARRRA